MLIRTDTDFYEFSVNVKVVAAPESEDDMEGRLFSCFDVKQTSLIHSF